MTSPPDPVEREGLRARDWPAEPEPCDGEHCQNCGRSYATVYHLPDDVWRRISPKGNEGGLLCPPCAAAAAHDAGINLWWEAAENEYPTEQAEAQVEQLTQEREWQNAALERMRKELVRVDEMAHKAKNEAADLDVQLRRYREALEPEKLARLFHETYERLAPDFGYVTRKESAVPWEDVPDQNKRLMIAVAEVIARAALGRGAMTEQKGLNAWERHKQWYRMEMKRRQGWRIRFLCWLVDVLALEEGR